MNATVVSIRQLFPKYLKHSSIYCQSDATDVKLWFIHFFFFQWRATNSRTYACISTSVCAAAEQRESLCYLRRQSDRETLRCVQLRRLQGLLQEELCARTMPTHAGENTTVHYMCLMHLQITFNSSPNMYGLCW